MPGSHPPWVFRYVEDPADECAKRLGRSAPLRPVVPVSLLGMAQSSRVTALVDSGSERTLATPGLARSIGLDLDGAPECLIGIGGGSRHVQFAMVTLQLYGDLMSDGSDEPLAIWEAEVGFFRTWEPAWAVVLGGIGFLDKFAVSFQRAGPALAIEDQSVFDERHGILIDQTRETQPRFKY